MSFAHLHCHTEGSFLDGMCRVKDLVRTAKEHGSPGVAITDHGVMYNVIPFYEECVEAGIKPLIGCEVYVAPGDRKDRTHRRTNYYHMVLLATNQQGYKNLIKLVSQASLEGFYYKPRVDTELLAQYHEGIVATSACLGGEIPQAIIRQELKAARHRASEFREIYGPDRFYLELQRHGLPEEPTVNEALVRISGQLNIPLVATNDVHYLRQEDADPHEVLLCIQTQTHMDDDSRLRYGPSTFHLASPEEMTKLFSDLPEALENTLRIVDMSDLTFDFSELHFPDYEVPAGHTHETYLEQLCRKAIPDTYPQPPPELEQRLKYELDIIQTKGYSAYFIIVWDFVRFARSRGIMSQARGSAAGSVVSYLLGLTTVDPLRYNLLFERFLNRDRQSMPDIDLDFADDRREEVIQYCRDKYGKDCVAQIIAFGTMAAKAAVRDAGRALNIPLPEVDKIAKLIPTVPGTTLDDSLKEIKELSDLYHTDASAKKLIDTAKSVEGLYRHASTHAAGVVITKEPITEYAPVQRMGENAVAIQYEWTVAERIGMLKMDFLGLRNLTVVDRCLRMIQEGRGETVDLKQIPFTDEKTFQLLQRADTVGVFQLESGGMQKLIRNLRPDRLEDIIALVALYRPGPLQSGMTDTFCKRKHGLEEVTYDHPLLEAILKDTYGLILYQEQVMQITMVLAGFSPGQAEAAMKAMSKKKLDEMAKLKPEFLQGAEQHDVPADVAQGIYDVMENFAAYGFNLNHSAAYAVLSYHTAYLKANYPAEFMASNLTSIADRKDKLALYIHDCRRLGLEVLAPNVENSHAEFIVHSDGGAPSRILMGLSVIKNVSHVAVSAILAARGDGPFGGLSDFVNRVVEASEGQTINKTTLECLVKCGALDEVLTRDGSHRAQALKEVERVLQAANSRHRSRSQGQVSLFGDEEEQELVTSVREQRDWVEDMSRDEQLAAEKDLLGIYVSDHPLNHLHDRLRQLGVTPLVELADLGDRQPVTIGGLIGSVRERTTRNGHRMAIITVEDLQGSVTVTLFPKTFEQYQELIEEDRIVLIEGRTQVRDSIGHDAAPAVVEVQAHKVTLIEVHNGQSQTEVHVRLGGNARRQELLSLRSLCAANPGDAVLWFHLTEEGRESHVMAGMKIAPTAELLESVRRLVRNSHGEVWVS